MKRYSFVSFWRRFFAAVILLVIEQKSQKVEAQGCQRITGGLLASLEECDVRLNSQTAVWAGRAGGLEGGRGSSQYLAPESTAQLLFENRLVSPFIRFHSPVIAGNGLIIVTSILGQVACYSSDGALLWMVSLNQLVESAPMIEGNIAYVSSDKGLHAIDLRIFPGGSASPYFLRDALRQIWVFESSGGGSASPFAQDNVVFFAGLNNVLYAIENVGTCNSNVHIGCNSMVPIVRWQTNLAFSPLSEAFYDAQDERCQRPFEISRSASLLCVQCRAVLPCAQRCFFCEDQTVSGFSPLRSSPVLAGSSLLVVAWDGLHSLSAQTGEQEWHALSVLESTVERAERFTEGTSFHRQRLLGLASMATDQVVVFPSGRWVIAVRADGSELWKVEMRDDVVSSPTLLPGGVNANGAGDAVLVGVRGGPGHEALVVCLQLADGARLWEHKTGSNATQALQPVVDGGGQVLYLSAKGLRSVNRSGGVQWTDGSCTGAGTYSAPALSDDGKIVALCHDENVRAYCCARCSGTAPLPAYAWTGDGGEVTVSISVAHRNLQRAGIRNVTCLLGGRLAEVVVKDATTVECVLPPKNLSVAIANGSAVTARDGAIVVEQQSVTMKQCAVEGSDWPASMPCSYTSADEVLLPVCRSALSTEAAVFRSRQEGAEWCSDCSSCAQSITVAVEVTVGRSDPQVCGGGRFTYWFPVEVDPDMRETPFKLPTDYSQLITQSSLGGVAVLLFLLLFLRAFMRIRRLRQDLEDDEVNQLAAWINSADLDPKVRSIIQKAKNRLSTDVMILATTFAAWEMATDMGVLQRIFDKVLHVKSAEQLELLREQHPQLKQAAALADYVDFQRNLGPVPWAHCRKVLDLYTMFVPRWGDLWAAYLESEVGIYAEKREAADACRRDARRARQWDMHSNMEKVRFNAAWGMRHVHSLSLNYGCSSNGNTVTKVRDDPFTSVAMRSYPLEHEKEKWTFAYFGETGHLGVGLSSERIALNAEPCSGRKSDHAWFYQSSGSSSKIVTGVVTVRVVEARIPWSFSHLVSTVRPMVRVRVGQRSWETPVREGRKPVWNQEVDTLLDGSESSVYVEVLDDRRNRLPFVIGAKSILVSDLRDSTLDKWYRLFGPRNSVVLVRLQTVFTVPPIHIDANKYFSEAKTVFNLTDTERTGAVRTSHLESNLSDLGYTFEQVSDVVFLSDPSCTGITPWSRFQSAFAQALYRADTAARRPQAATDSTSESSEFTRARTMPFKPWNMPDFRASMSKDEDSFLAQNHSDEDMLLAASPVARMLGRAAAAALLREAQTVLLDAGDTIAEQGEQLECLILVKKGNVTVRCKNTITGITAEEDEERLMGEIGAGHLIGETPCLTKTALSMSFIAKTDCEVLKIQQQALLQKTNPLKVAPPVSSGRRQLRSESALPGALIGALQQTRQSLRLVNPAYDSLVEKEVLEAGENPVGGRLVQNGSTVALGLPAMESGDRIQVTVEQGRMSFAVNGTEVGEPLSGFDAEVYPMVFVSGKGSSLTPVDERERLIRVVCVGAEDLPRMDLFTGSADPYCTVHQLTDRHEMQRDFLLDNYKTSVVSNCLSPDWGEAFVISPKSRDEFIVVRVWDQDKIGDDDLIGQVAVPVRDLEFGRRHDGRYRLEGKQGKMVPNAILHLSFEVSDTSRDYQRARRMSLAWRKSLREADNVWKPRIKDLGPSVHYPSPTLVRAVFQRALNARLTLPQVRYLFDFWEHFEMKIAKTPDDRLRIVRELVTDALSHVQEANSIRPFLIHPDTAGESWLWTALQGHEKKRQDPDPRAKREADMMRKMMAYRISGQSRIVPGRDAMPLKVKRARQTAGAALFLVPGSLSGLMSHDDAAFARVKSARDVVVSQIRKKKQVQFVRTRAALDGRTRSTLSRGSQRGGSRGSQRGGSRESQRGGAAANAPADVIRFDSPDSVPDMQELEYIEKMALERGWELDVDGATNRKAQAASAAEAKGAGGDSGEGAMADSDNKRRQGGRRTLRGGQPKEALRVIVQKRMISVIRLTKYVSALQRRDSPSGSALKLL